MSLSQPMDLEALGLSGRPPQSFRYVGRDALEYVQQAASA
jgi:hypothetical protein